MSIATTVPAPIEITRRRLAGLLAAATAAAAALTWAVTTVAIDTTAEPARTTTPAISTHPWHPTWRSDRCARRSSRRRRPADLVADAYHGVGFTVCPDGAQPINVADSYHGVGATVCP